MITNDQSNEKLPIVKTDVLGRVKVDAKYREAMLDAFEASSMSAAAFALEHGVKQQTFASWVQKRRRSRGDYDNENIRRKLRMGKKPPQKTKQPATVSEAPVLNFIELNTASDPSSSPTESPTALKINLTKIVSVNLHSECQIPLLKTLVKALEC